MMRTPDLINFSIDFQGEFAKKQPSLAGAKNTGGKRKKVYRVVKRLRTSEVPDNERVIGFANGRKVIVKRPKDVADNFLRAAVLTTKYDEFKKEQKNKKKRIFRTQPILLPPNVVVGAPQYAPAGQQGKPPKFQCSVR